MTRARELARLANENVFTAEDYNSPVEVGINSTSPSSTLDVRGDLKVGTAIQAGTAGVVTATEFSGSIGTFSGAGSFGGNLDVTGNVTIGGTLTYEDVTNIDSVGIVTARAGVNVSGGQLLVGSGVTIGNAGVATFSGTSDIHLLDNVQLNVGDGSDLTLLHNGSNSVIANTTGLFVIKGDSLHLKNYAGSEAYLTATADGSVDIYYNNSKKWETTKDGTITTGIATATSFDSTSSSTFNDRVYWKSSGTTKMSTLASNAGMNWQDSVKAEFGNSGDLKIYHESNVNYIYGGSTNFPTVFMTNATERVRIKGDGETNIGTGATTIAKFCLTGASNGGHQIIGQASNNVAALDVYSQHGNDANKLSFAVSDNRTGSKSNSFVVRGDGKVGVGTDNPGTVMHLLASDTYLTMQAGSASGNGGILFKDSGGTQNSVILYDFDDDYLKITTNDDTERLRITSSGNVDINGTPPWTVSGGDYRNLSISGQTASSSGFIWLGNGAAASNADFDVARIRLCNGGTEVAQIAASTYTSATDDGRLTFSTKSTSASITERIRIQGNGQILYSAAGGDNTITSKRTNAAGSNGNYFFQLNANNTDNNTVGSLGFHRDTAVDDSRLVLSTRATGGSNTERLRIASDGEVFIGDGFGVTDRSTLLSVSGTNQDPTGSWAQVGLYSNDSQAADKGGSIGFGGQDGTTTKQQFAAIKGAKENSTSGNYAGYMTFFTRPNGAVTQERMRISSDGVTVVHGGGTNYGPWPGGASINTTSMAMINTGSSGTTNWGWAIRGNSGDVQWCLERIKDETSFDDSNIKFRVYNNGNYLFAGTDQSDRDVKENILDITGTSLDKIKQLKPRTFNFIESEGYSTETKTGFIAQEVASVIPSITNGTDGQKDMGVDYNGLVAHLVKAIKELSAKVEELESKLNN